MRGLVIPVVLVLVIALSLGCATFNKLVTNNELISQLAVEAATARVLNENPSWRNTTIGISEGAVKAIEASAIVSIGDLENYVRDRVKWYNLSPEEQALVSVLISQTRQNLEDSFRAQKVTNPLNEMIEVKKVMKWINETAKRGK